MKAGDTMLSSHKERKNGICRMAGDHYCHSSLVSHSLACSGTDKKILTINRMEHGKKTLLNLLTLSSLDDRNKMEK